MTEIKILKRIDFDNLENHYPTTKKRVGVFIAKDGLTAQGHVAKYFEKLEPVKLYLGYDGEVYPQFIMETEQTKE